MRFRRGLVWGKFLPLHAGHSALVRAAQGQCDEVLVVVGAHSDEPVPREVRHAWVGEVHPDVVVRSHVDDTPVDYDDPAVWDLHLAGLRSVVPEPVDAVFTSEAYGDELARRLDAVHVCVDLPRRQHPVSGTAVRADPGAHWAWLSPPVRAWYARRVVVVGAESTGTTTLASALAARLGCPWVPEFGRAWTVERPGGPTAPWRSEEFDLVARRQAQDEDAAARTTPVPWLVCDTDPLATAVWHERYVGTRSATVEAFARARVPHLYVLTRDDVPFEQDGLRDGEHLRPWMTQRFREVLATQPAPVLEVGGSVADRLEVVLGRLEVAA
ncbi:MAG: cytidyltransferase [Frankiales bacterium]|nr:cytidyltransferase [Frankiales bacterium]